MWKLLPFALLLLHPQSIKTDYGNYPAPVTPPALAAAGATATDPVFGSTVTRMTDSRDGLNCGTVYSYWSSWNRDGTWLMAACTATVSTWTEPVAVFFQWDKAGARPIRKITKHIGDAQYAIDLTTGIWSGLDRNLMFVPKGGVIYSWNVETNAVAILKDFASMLPGEYMWQVFISRDDNRFSFTRKLNANYNTAGYAVWDRKADKLILKTDTTVVDEVQIDKSGRYLVVKTGQSGATTVESRIVTLATGAVYHLFDGSPDYALGHSDNGNGVQVGEENWLGRIWKYSLSDPSKKLDLIGQDMWSWNTGGGHYSMSQSGDGWVLGSTNGGDNVLASELYFLATDGSTRIRRFLHHHSVYKQYEDSPRPVVSRDGEFVAFTSNWGGTSRHDMYVTRVPPPASPDITSGDYHVTAVKQANGNIFLTLVPIQ